MLNPSAFKNEQGRKMPSQRSRNHVGGNEFWVSIERERIGVPVTEFVENIQKLGMTKTRAAQVFKLSRSTLTHKKSSDDMLVRTNALAAIRLEKLCSLAECIVKDSLHSNAKSFNSGKWLGAWIEMRHPVLGGLRPSDLLDTEAGATKVYQVLGALESGVYL